MTLVMCFVMTLFQCNFMLYAEALQIVCFLPDDSTRSVAPKHLQSDLSPLQLLQNSAAMSDCLKNWGFTVYINLPLRKYINIRTSEQTLQLCFIVICAALVTISFAQFTRLKLRCCFQREKGTMCLVNAAFYIINLKTIVINKTH